MTEDTPIHALPTSPAATAGPPSEPSSADVFKPLEQTGFDAVVDDAEDAATDTVTAPHGTSGADVSDARQPTPVVRTPTADPTISFKTHHSNLSVLADILPILAPAPALTTTVNASTQERSLTCTVEPDGLLIELGTSSLPCHLRVPIVPEQMPDQVVSFQLPAWVLRVAARQPPKEKTRRKKIEWKPLRRSERFSLRARAPEYGDCEPITWKINSAKKEGELSGGGITMRFDAQPAMGKQHSSIQELGSTKAVAPERICKALLACLPAASADNKLPERCLVDIKDGVARAGDGRWFAHHRDSALSDLDVAVGRADIVTLVALLQRLDPTATTLRNDGDLYLLTDGRLTVGFTPPKMRASVWASLETWLPTLAFSCATEALKKLSAFAGTIVGSSLEDKRNLQLRLFLELHSGDIVLRVRTTQGKLSLDETGIAITMANSQVHAVRERLGHDSRGTLNAYSNINEERGSVEVATLPPTQTVNEGEMDTQPDPATAATIELGRYAYAELATATKLVRSGLTQLGFKEHPTAGATVMIVTEAAADHTSTYVIPARAEDTTPGFRKRRPKSSYSF